MSAYDDLIPGTARRRSAYEDLLPARTPAPGGPPAEVADAAAEAPSPGITLAQRAAIAAEPYVSAVTPALKTVQAVASGYPVLETAANLATGAVAMPVSGIAGLAAAAAKALGYDTDPAAVVDRTARALTYEPRTDLGEHLTRSTLYPLEKLAEVGRAAGEKLQDIGASPAAATAAETAIVGGVPLLLGARGRATKPRELPVEQRIEPKLTETPTAAAEAPKRIEAKPELPAEVPVEPPVVKPAAPGAKPSAATAYEDLVPSAAALPGQRIGKVVEMAVEPGRAGNETWAVYRKVGAEEAKALKNVTGLDLTGYQHHVDEAAIRHVLAEHGNEQIEAQRGQIPVTREDFAKLPEITNPKLATVEMSGKTHSGREAIRYSRQIGDNYYVVEEVRTGRKRLALVTMWKTRAAPDALGLPRSPAQTSETFGTRSGPSVSPKKTGGNEPGSLGMPAHAGTVPAAAAGATPPARASGAIDTSQARPDAIRKAMADLFDTAINEKHQGARNLGIYRIKPETIRVRNRNDLRTVAHEVGHHISNRNKAFREVMRAHDAELIPMMPQAYKQRIGAGTPMPRKLQIEEGFAEFIAEYLGDRPVAQSKAPAFFKAFETWLAANKPYQQAIGHVSDMIGAHQALGPAEKIRAKVGAYEQPLRERAAALVSKETYDTFVQATLDKWHPLKTMVADLAPGLEPSKNPYVQARLLAGDAAVIEDWVGHFTSPFDYAKRLDVKNYGQSLKQILAPIIGGDLTELQKHLVSMNKGDKSTIDTLKDYLIARRAAELKKVGKENLLTSEEIAGGLSLETPLLKSIASDIYAYNDRLVEYAVEGGLLSPEVAAKFKEYTAYIPFFREAEATGKAGGRGQPFKRLTGGTANLRDPIANLIQNTANIIHATNRNAVLARAVELAKATPGGGTWLETVPLPMQAHHLATKRIIEQLEKQGVVVEASMAEDLAAMQTFFTKAGKGDERTRTIVYKQAGELKAAQVNDPLLWKALGNLPPLELGLIGKILAFPAQTLRAGVVLDPTFMVRNLVRDTLSATVQSQGKFLPVASTAEGIKLMAQQKDAYKLWRSFGGAFADKFREPHEAAAVLNRMAKRGGFQASSIISPWRLLDALKKAGSFSESGSRIGEFQKTYKPGDPESALASALGAREVSTDFGMHGGAEWVQVLTRVTPFMNPAMQGLYKGARVLSGGDGRAIAGKAAAVGASMALFSITLALLNSDEPWYQRLEDWERATYWHFKIGGEIYRMPKPFEYGALFATMPENIALLQQGKESWRDFKSMMLQTLGQVFGFRAIPQAATIVMEPWANKSIFTGRPIVPDRNSKLEPGLQANPSTTHIAQVVGEQANISPAVIDNAVRNIFGTVGVHVETVADLILEASGAVPKGHAKTWRSWPVLKAFVHDPDNPNTKQQNQFYEDLQSYRRAVATVREYRNRGEDSKADAYADAHAEEIQRAKEAESAARRLAKLRKAMRAIERDRDLSPEEKRGELNVRNEEMRDIIEGQTPLYQAVKKSYAQRAEGGL